MANATINSETLSLGPGRLLWAPLGTALPVDHSTALAAAYKEIGSTEEGSEFSYEISSDPVTVAESYDPLFYKTTGRSGTVSFAMAENTVRNLTLAFNGGTITGYGTGPTAGFKYEPPEPGNEKSIVLVFESEDNEERWVWKQTTQGGSVAFSRRQGADKTTVPVEFRVERPAAGGAPWTAFYATVRSGGAVAT